nr:zinc knuckle CX2CX4HX4C [Tanacetum cinerariifolium]
MSKIADPVGNSGATYGSQHGVINRGGNSFASVLQAKLNKKVVKIQVLRNENVVEGAAVTIPFEAVEEVKSSMCLSSWGKSTYARALIEVSAENELLDSLVIAIPIDKDNGHTLATIDVEYE